MCFARSNKVSGLGFFESGARVNTLQRHWLHSNLSFSAKATKRDDDDDDVDDVDDGELVDEEEEVDNEEEDEDEDNDELNGIFDGENSLAVVFL